MTATTKLIVALTLVPGAAVAAQPPATRTLGGELRVYPTGLITAGRLDAPIGQNGWFLNAGIGVNRATMARPETRRD